MGNLHVIGVVILAFSSSCKFKKADAAAGSLEAVSCQLDRAGVLSLCNEYRNLSAEEVEKAQKTCESFSANGYTWVRKACDASDRVGACVLGARTRDGRLPSVQYQYSPFFSKDVAEGICQEMEGTFARS